MQFKTTMRLEKVRKLDDAKHWGGRGCIGILVVLVRVQTGVACSGGLSVESSLISCALGPSSDVPQMHPRSSSRFTRDLR